MRALSRWPWWLQVLAVYGATRALAALIFVVVAQTQEANPWTGAAPSYAEYTGLMWDASWYRTIAEDGYPAELPRGPDGMVQQNAWAFFPLFPVLVRVVTQVTGLPWHVAAPTLALLLGAGAMLTVHLLVAAATPMVTRHARLLPITTVAVLSTFAAAPVLQTAYTESLALLLIAGVLLCVVQRRYLAAFPLVLALGLTRAVALPIAAAVVLHGLSRWSASRRDNRPDDRQDDRSDSGTDGGTDVGARDYPLRERWATAALAVVAVLSGVLWPALSGWATGEADGYLETQAAWRGRGEVVPLVPWLDVSQWLFGRWGPGVLVVVVGLAVALVLSGPVRRLGPVLQGWTAGYLAYLLLVVEPWTSLVRFLLLAFPVAAAVGGLVLRSRRRWVVLAVVLGLGVVTQVAWVALLWRLVPPAGWPP